MPWSQESIADERAGSTTGRGAGAWLPAWLRHRHRVRHRSTRPVPGDDPLHFSQEEGTAIPARLAPARVGALVHDEGTALVQAAVQAHRLPGHLVLLRPQGEDRWPEEPVGSGSEAAGHL